MLRPDVRVGIWHSSEDHDASDAAGEKTACFPLLFAQHATSSSRHEGCCNIPRSKWSLPPRGGGDCFLVKSKHPGGNQEPEGGSSFSIAVPGRVFSWGVVRRFENMVNPQTAVHFSPDLQCGDRRMKAPTSSCFECFAIPKIDFKVGAPRLRGSFPP